MMIRFALGFLLLFQFHLTNGQEITLDDLVYFQSIKDFNKIDSVLLTKDKWDCNCFRDDPPIGQINHWIYDIPNTTKGNIDKDYIRINKVGNGFSSTLTFYTTDTRKATIILEDIVLRKLKEEKIQNLQAGDITAKVSFYVSDKFAIQTVIGKNKEIEQEKYAFVFMEKEDYLKGLMIK